MKILFSIHALAIVERMADNVIIERKEGYDHLNVSTHEDSKYGSHEIDLSLEEINNVIDVLTFMRDAIQDEQGNAPTVYGSRHIGLPPRSRPINAVARSRFDIFPDPKDE